MVRVVVSVVWCVVVVVVEVVMAAVAVMVLVVVLVLVVMVISNLAMRELERRTLVTVGTGTWEYGTSTMPHRKQLPNQVQQQIQYSSNTKNEAG